MFNRLRAFIRDPNVRHEQAVQSLRLIFALVFLGQLGFVILIGLVFFLFFSPSARNPILLAQILLAFAIILMPLSLAVAALAARPGGKGGALAAVISLAVMLSAPAWYALLAMLLGVSVHYLLYFMLLLMLAYTLGFVRSSFYAKLARQSLAAKANE